MENSMTRLNVDRYTRDGYQLLPRALAPGDLAPARAFFDLLDQGEVPATYEPEYDHGADGTARLRKLRRLVWNDPGFWAPIINRSGAADVARELVGAQAAIVFHAAFLKPARVGTAVALHQDQALWSMRYPRAVSVWFALSEVSPANGGLFGCPGSHVSELAHRDRPQYTWHPSLDAVEDGLAEPVQFTLEPGDAVVWDRYFAHGSAANTSAVDRRGMVVVFADAGDPGFQARDAFPLAELRAYGQV